MNKGVIIKGTCFQHKRPPNQTTYIVYIGGLDEALL